MSKKIDIILSSYNEEGNILPFYNEAKKYLKSDKYRYNLVFIDDGSTDKTYSKVQEVKKKVDAEKNITISVISFTHNFGHEAAMCAGLDMTDAEYLIFMDVDLQNPPRKIPEIMEAFEKGADCVLLRRVKYNATCFIKVFFSKSYYLFSKIILRNKNERDVSDFFAIDKSLAKTIREKYKTRLRFVRSFVQKEAKKIAIVNYDNEARYDGKSRYNFFKLSKLAIISELSRSKKLRDTYPITKEKPVYVIDKAKTIYK